jgi:hypothetical protein
VSRARNLSSSRFVFRESHLTSAPPVAIRPHTYRQPLQVGGSTPRSQRLEGDSLTPKGSYAAACIRTSENTYLPGTTVNKGMKEGQGFAALALPTDPVGLALVVGRVEDHCEPLAIFIDHAQLVRLKSGCIERRCLDQREHDLVAVRRPGRCGGGSPFGSLKTFLRPVPSGCTTLIEPCNSRGREPAR